MAWIYLSRKWHEAEFLKCHRWTSAENNGNYHNELHWELEEEHMETRHDSHKQHLWHSVWRTLTQCVPAYSSPCAPVVLPATWLQNRSELPWNLLLIPVYTVHFHKYMNCVFWILNCPCWKQSVWYYGTGDKQIMKWLVCVTKLKDEFIKKENQLKMYSTSGHPICK